MKVLDSSEYIVMTISDAETRRFEAFLDRNFSHWRDSIDESYTGVARGWYLPLADTALSHAIYRKVFVELFDEFEDTEERYGFVNLNGRICDIDGDLTPAAIWKQKSQ
jgi:hypothetical protein